MRGLPMTTRLKLAGKALTGLFEPGDATAAFGLLSGIFHGTGGTFPERSTYDLINTFNTSPWARACSLRVADAFSATHWRLYVQRSNGKPVQNQAIQKSPFRARKKRIKEVTDEGNMTEVENHILLDLLRDGNTEFNGPELWWLYSIWMDLIGDTFFVKQRNKLGKPENLWPVPPHWVVGTPTPERPFYRVSYRSWVGEIPQTEMLWAKNPNPVNPYWRGSGLAKALDDEIEVDEFAVKHRKSYFANSARPDMIVMPKEGGILGGPERDRLERWWNDKLQGFWRSYKPLFMTAPMEIKTIEQNFQQMQFSELRNQEAEIIMQVWGVGPELFGRLSSSNRATITQALRIFGHIVMLPRLERLRHWLQANLVPEYDAPLILDYDSPIPDDYDFQLNVMKTQPNAFQLNEFRHLASLQDDPDLEGEYGAAAAKPGAAAPGEEGAPGESQPSPPTTAELEKFTGEELKTVYEIINRASKREMVST